MLLFLLKILSYYIQYISRPTIGGSLFFIRKKQKQADNKLRINTGTIEKEINTLRQLVSLFSIKSTVSSFPVPPHMEEPRTQHHGPAKLLHHLCPRRSITIHAHRIHPIQMQRSGDARPINGQRSQGRRRPVQQHISSSALQPQLLDHGSSARRSIIV